VGDTYALFVGGTFYANVAGITWFVKNVVPHITIKTLIVGKGFEALRGNLEQKGKVEVVGTVVNVADWYRKAQFVVAPIFDGSGMKTKVAEALMFGKKIIGTREAFSGYEDVAERAGWVCNTADEFISAICQEQNLNLKEYDLELRALFNKRYSIDAATVRFKSIMNS
jgi:glycosyltransferase involved in cell wall biosynthesis